MPSDCRTRCFRATLMGFTIFWLALAAQAGAQARTPPVASQLSLSPPADLSQPPADAARSPSGLVSKRLVAGSGSEPPDDNDVVSLHLAAWTPEGQLFTNSVQSGQPAVFDVPQMFPGLREGVLGMVQGEVRRLWVPEALAPPKQAQAPHGAVVIDVELLGIIRLPPPPPDLGQRPADAERTATGVFSKVLQKGGGTTRPAGSTKVLVHYTGWTRDGKVFDSTLRRSRPTLFVLSATMPAFAEGVLLMTEGEKRRLWIPAALNQGQWPGSPKGDLVFDVELVKILG